MRRDGLSAACINEKHAECEQQSCRCNCHSSHTDGGVYSHSDGIPGVLTNEAVDHPQHYGGDSTYEHIKVADAWGLDYRLGNATKYICRAGKKGGTREKAIEDLKKAEWYIRSKINQLESEV